VWVHIYVGKRKKWCNVNEIKLIINSNQAPNSWEDLESKVLYISKMVFKTTLKVL
jgi:hypothetical protein